MLAEQELNLKPSPCCIQIVPSRFRRASNATASKKSRMPKAATITSHNCQKLPLMPKVIVVPLIADFCRAPELFSNVSERSLVKLSP